jgi:5-methyltetrahydrofolate--homocysteine methyltransferase
VDYPIKEVIDYIDWNPFFATWQLRGKYPNRGYPKIFDDKDVGPEAKKVFEDAQNMLKQIIQNKLLIAKAVVGFYPANSINEDIEIYKDNSRKEVLATLFGIRQQAETVRYSLFSKHS